MSDQGDAGEKTHEPTPRKLDEARRKGEVPRAADLTTAASYAGLVLVAMAAGAGSLRGIGTTGAVIFDQAEGLAPLLTDSARAPIGGLLSGLGRALAPWFTVPALAVIATLLALRALVFAPDKLKPKISRISPIANAKNKFGRSGLFEFFKSFVKLVVISGLLWMFLLARLPRITGTIHLSPAMITAELLQIVLEFLTLVVAILLVIGGGDYLWQVNEHHRKQRMTHKELRDEVKQAEGDPHMKQQRRQRGQEIATNRMLTEVPKADVVIVNPTHYAVALKWSRAEGTAPICVAKGTDEIAARIREAATAAGVPIRRDPPTARALHAAVELGQEIPPANYRAVAAAIRFAESMRRRAGSR
ncbi:EscU/YscU/HrcU family type III secretion system export apparatus switch protein [Alkalilacustris brevis]|uniref:EscU/YscU/HrcU family type III secretion system export apparatus switch protein n=1 Tax=Alkalilacustris brevis TaxID=2026338 RepID=UPI000E0D3A25|nr:flagellar type III secretion system protein FlhB [Alkalilacustris brevis]